MRSCEFISEAHHSILATRQIGPWNVHIDTHAIASQASRGIDLADFTNIITHACFLPNTLNTIPVGKGAYFQDLNTRISIYIYRLGNDELRIETVLGPDMKPKPPMFRRAVPSHNIKIDPRVNPAQNAVAQVAQQHGRDYVSQHLSDLAPIANMNRTDRRAFNRLMKKKKL